MLHFSKLKLHGFKSFVDNTELVIGPGMTGIVGPNGCGKSNLVEALRWVMGETSPKRMRGSAMDDVIFGGTAMRPARNVAEVTLELDNATRAAPSEYNNEEVIAVMRQIARDEGSDYRINGRPARQRDVQLLFADLATGAHSTSMVGQGQIDALIRAKPQERRQILEEASGTSGLQARRHEAELKLKGAEQNLTRVDDVLSALDTQLRGLKTQVRQASRYRNLAEHIRRTEAMLLHLRWAAGKNQAGVSREALIAAENTVNEFLAIVTRSTTERTNAAAELPGLRQAEAAAAAVVQRLALNREQLESELQRIRQETQLQKQRREQAQQDHGREQNLRQDAETALAGLGEENERLQTHLAALTEELPQVQTELEAISTEVGAFEKSLNTLTQNIAEAEAKHNGLTRRMAELEERRATLKARREDLVRQRDALQAENAARPDLALAQAMIDACEQNVAKRQEQVTTAETDYTTCETAHKAAREEVRAAEAGVTRLKAEADAIGALLGHADHEGEQLIDSIKVAPGYESALAAALGEALTAPLHAENAAMHWRLLPPLNNPPSLPVGAEPFAAHIEAPEILQRALKQIGLVPDAETGQSLATALVPGQILVSQDGWAWRWDGFTVSPAAPTATAVRLQQRNRLNALQAEIEVAGSALAVAQMAYQDQELRLAASQQFAANARRALQQAYAALNDARQHHARHAEAAAAAQSRLTALDDSIAHLALDEAALTQQAGQAQAEMSSLPDTAAMRHELDALRLSLAEKRQIQIERQSKLDRAAREQQSLTARLEQIANENRNWQQRAASAASQMETMTARMAELDASLAELEGKPAQLEEQRALLLTQSAEAENRRKEAADALIMAENHVTAIEQQLKRDENKLTEARENRIRAEAAVEAADEHLRVIAQTVAEKLDCSPEQVLAAAGLEESSEFPPQQELEEKLAKYIRERDNMGPVNLRAEVEAETVEADIQRLQTEKDDLVNAIAKLRQGIGQLNREARERLQEAFQKVDERFQILFKRLFNGGKAHLQLLDTEDPLNAGLEIFASPPGKKMQILSLLSGGERSLTAIALLFAVFQTNPSPICVLDEAEAALDESNIDRFCTLVEDIARETGTRFLVITHQRLTMARMDRLFGVTMGEKGVSQLVSVDLAQAEAVRDGELPDELLELVAAE